MTRARDISKIVTDANLSGTLDVTGTVTAGGLDIQGDGTISGGSRLTISDIADENNDGIRLDDSTTARYNNLTQDSSGNFKIQHWTGSAWQNNFTLTTDGNVGIGISSNIARKLHVQNDGDYAAKFGGTGAGDYSIEIGQIGASGSAGLNATGNNGAMKFMISGSEKMRIAAPSGNVGIGTTSPSLATASASASGLEIKGTVPALNLKESSGNDEFLLYGGASSATIYTVNNLRFLMSGSEKMRLDTSGNVGIGTSSPSVKLHAEGAGNQLVLINNSSTNDGIYLKAGTGESSIQTNSGSNVLNFYTSGNERMRIDSSGHVGILNTTPSSYLDGELVVGNSSKDQYINVVTGTVNAAGICFQDTTGTSIVGGLRYTHLDNALASWANGAERMRITSDGKVGIGTSSPSQALTINDGSITSNVTHTFNLFGATGTGGSPAYVTYSFVGDPNTGMFSGTADTLKFATGGTERARLNSLGFLRQTNSGSYRGFGTSNYNELNTNASGDGVLVAAISNASYQGGGLQVVAVRSNYTGMNLLEIYSGDAADRELRIDGAGQVFADGAYSATGADYAEMFEWSDGNTTNEDRVGKTVVLDGNQIRLSTSSDAQSSIIGVVSARPVVLGDSQSEKWIGKYETDDFGRYIREEYTQTEWIEEDEDGNKSLKTYQTDLIPSDITVPSDAIVTSTEVDGVTPLTRRRLNPSFDPSQTYIPREQRKEFSPIGLVGKLKVRIGQTVGDRWIKMREISDTVHEYLVR